MESASYFDDANVEQIPQRLQKVNKMIRDVRCLCKSSVHENAVPLTRTGVHKV
jgi:hypothetical protein